MRAVSQEAFEQAKQDLRRYTDALTRDFTCAMYVEAREDRLDRLARGAGRVIFGDILNPPDDPLKGLAAMIAEMSGTI